MELGAGCAPVRLGVHIGYWGLGLTAAEQLELVLEAERLGYDSVWTAEAYGSDAVDDPRLARRADRAHQARLGDPPDARPLGGDDRDDRGDARPALGGRMLLGIGSSGPQVAEGWHGQRFGRQLQRTREYVDVVRMALRRERVRYEGETLQLPLPDGPGKALKLTIAPGAGADPDLHRGDRPEEHHADRGDRRRLDPDPVLARARRRVPAAARGGLRARGRRQVVRRLRHRADGAASTSSDDRGAARDALRHFFALYVGGMGSRDKNFYNQLVRRYGFEDAAQRGAGPVPRRAARTRPPPRCPTR